MPAVRAAALLLCLVGVAGCSCEIETAHLPDGAVNVPYSARLETSSPCGDGVWALAAGTPPPGVSLFSDGRLSGIPITEGTFSFMATFQEGGVTNSPGRTTEKSFTINIGAF